MLFAYSLRPQTKLPDGGKQGMTMKSAKVCFGQEFEKGEDKFEIRNGKSTSKRQEAVMKIYVHGCSQFYFFCECLSYSLTSAKLQKKNIETSVRSDY